MWTREQLKRNGKFAFQRNYWPCVGVTFIMMVVSAVFSVGSSWGTGDIRYLPPIIITAAIIFISHSYTRYFSQGRGGNGHRDILVALLVALLRYL